MVLIILIDIRWLHLFNPLIYHVLALLAIVPLAANTVAYATQLNAHPEKAAVTVLASTLWALIYIPLIMSLLFKFLPGI
jgi:predicted permease